MLRIARKRNSGLGLGLGGLVRTCLGIALGDLRVALDCNEDKFRVRARVRGFSVSLLLLRFRRFKEFLRFFMFARFGSCW